MDPAFQSYLTYFETLTPQTVHELRSLASPELHFVDPFNDVRGVEAVISIFEEMFEKLREPRFRVLDTAVSELGLYAKWGFDFELPLFWVSKKRFSIQGMSFVRADSQGRICEHIDYWDASSQLYMHLPVVGLFIRALRKTFA